MHGAAKEFRGLWVEPLDGRSYRWRCASCTWSKDAEHGDDVPEALDDFLIHQHVCPVMGEDIDDEP